MTKDEAAQALGVSKRSVDRYVNQGKLHVSHKKGKSGKIADFNSQEVEALKRELQGAAAIPLVSIDRKLLLTIEEAAAISGLTTKDIEEAIEQGSLKKVRGKIKRADLKRFVSSLSD